MELAAPFQDETGSNPVKECLSINIERTARPPAISSGAFLGAAVRSIRSISSLQLVPSCAFEVTESLRRLLSLFIWMLDICTVRIEAV